MNLKVKNALISISNKENLNSLLKTFKKYHINIISSGGTYAAIKKLGYQCTELSKYTGFKEMLDGRVKTLHPKIHAGILHDRQNKKHKSEMFKQNFPAIDLIVVNFYPFQKIVSSTKNPKQIIENIDIGGPTMVRAAAKNFKNVTIITSKDDYQNLIKEINKNKGKTSIEFRELMSSKAFGLTAYYDSMIAKLITTAQTREEAINKMKRALDEFIVEGIKTTIPFHKKLMNNPEFINGNYTTKFMETF